VNWVPITTATASCTRFPRMMKFLKPFMTPPGSGPEADYACAEVTIVQHHRPAPACRRSSGR
jgi:hypothetical protein